MLPTNGEKPAANASVPSNQHQTPSTAPPPPPAPLSRKKLKKQEKRKQKLLLRNATSAPVPTPQPQSVKSPLKKYVKFNFYIKSLLQSYPAASVNCNNQDFTLDNFRLPPGITLTRVHQGSYPHSAHPELPVRMVDQRNNNKKGSVNSGTNTSQTGPNPIIVTNPPKAKESMGKFVTIISLNAPDFQVELLYFQVLLEGWPLLTSLWWILARFRRLRSQCKCAVSLYKPAGMKTTT